MCVCVGVPSVLLCIGFKFTAKQLELDLIIIWKIFAADNNLSRFLHPDKLWNLLKHSMGMDTTSASILQRRIFPAAGGTVQTRWVRIRVDSTFVRSPKGKTPARTVQRLPRPSVHRCTRMQSTVWAALSTVIEMYGRPFRMFLNEIYEYIFTTH